MRNMGGGMENFPLCPEVLSPTVAFHDAILKKVRYLGFEGRSFPYKYKSNDVNIRINLYLDKYIAITLVVKNAIETPIDKIGFNCKLINNPELYQLACTVAGLIIDGNLKTFSPRTSIPSLPCSQVEHILAGSESVPNKVLVSALTGHSNSTDNIVSKVVGKNEHHQVNDALTLVDKQGVIQYIPDTSLNRKEVTSKFNSCTALFELFAVISQSSS